MFEIVTKGALDGKNIKFDFGCGANKERGHIGVDKRKIPGVDIVSDVAGFMEMPAKCASVISSCHFVEHLDLNEFQSALLLWSNILNENGILKISFPDISLIRHDVKNKVALCHILGAWTHDDDIHKTYWSIEMMYHFLKEAGYKKIHSYAYEGNLHPKKEPTAWTSTIEATL